MPALCITQSCPSAAPPPRSPPYPLHGVTAINAGSLRTGAAHALWRILQARTL